ncbi:hypothetical protein HOLleu_05680 [Holothuria leucospilota]|uniref:Uncharacterized protein n=1 Tax=Holothuria leucospilota TaxID=206669 RepID=A0A9Q1CKA1_HOLLE|nr:hypothetical protein HOLleu_05680 [Holothuria leucospilota]
MAGDFNFVFNLDLDKVGGLRKTSFKARDECLTLMTTFNLVDIWREKNPFLKFFTWSSNITPGIHCRLDFYLVSRNLEHNVNDASFSPGLQSDHSFISLSFMLTSMKRGPGYWKFNNSLLNDASFTNIINDIIRIDAENPNSENPVLRWENLKFKFLLAAIRYGKQKAAERRLKEELLLNKISGLEQKLFLAECPVIRSQLRSAQNKLLPYYEYKLQGTIIRSRARWVEDGEKNSKYFLNLEKRNKENYHIRKLVDSEGRFFEDEGDILKEIRHFYSTLYSSANTSVGSFFNNLDHPNLSIDDSKLCDGELTLGECSTALSLFK